MASAARRRNKRTSAFLTSSPRKVRRSLPAEPTAVNDNFTALTRRRNPQKRRKPAPNAQVSKAEPQGRQPGQVGGIGFVPLAVVGFDEVKVSNNADFSAVADVESFISRQGLKFVEQRWAPRCGKSG